MNRYRSTLFVIMVAVWLITLPGAFSATDTPVTYCRFVPERVDDFAWENDKIAFRAYGPALHDKAEDSGFDCWLKRVDYPIINKWYKENAAGKSYHKDYGEGYDPYKAGSSRGCGGVIDPTRIVDFQLLETGKKLEDHALLITKTDDYGKLEYYAGYGWAKAGEIKTSAQWNTYLAGFAQ